MLERVFTVEFRLMKTTLANFCDLLTRLTVGFMFANSGWGKIANLESFVNEFAEWGIPAPSVTAPAAAWAELIAGALLMIGLATRLAALAMAAVMAGALFIVVAPPIVEEASTLTGVGSNLFYAPEWLLLLIFITLAATGAGTWSVDRILNGRKRKS